MRFFAVPLGHKVLAVLIAVAVAGGLHAWFRHNGAQSASAAELSFDPDAAQRLDPALAGGNDPAVAIAQSMLTDQVVAGLSKQAYLSAGDMTTRMGEFRSRLELTQPGVHALEIRFQDADLAKSVETENAVANALAWSTPSSSATLPPAVLPKAAVVPAKTAAPPKPAAPPPPAPAKKTSQPDQNASALAASLGQLQAELSSTNRKLEEIGSSSGGSHRGAYAYRHSYSESEQQQLIKAQVRTAEKKVQDLRTQYASGNADAGTKERLVAIQGALSSILSAGSGGRYRLSAGISASRLREERAELTHAISVVGSERQAIEREAASRPAPASDVAAQTPPASTTASNPPAQTPPASTAASNPPSNTASTTESDLPSPNASPAPTQPTSGPAPVASVAGPSTPGPFRLVRLAGSAPPVLWWPAALAGLVCGLLYWGVAAWPNRMEEETAYGGETPSYGGRFITPDEPVVVAAPAARAMEKEEADRVSYKRASFTYEEPPSGQGQPASIFREPAPKREAPLNAASLVDEKPPSIQEKPASIDPAPVSTGESFLNAAPHVVSSNAASPVIEEPGVVSEKSAVAAAGEAAAAPENVVEMPDPWADLVKKALAETEIGRIFEGAPDRDQKGGANEKEDRQRPVRPDRLAG